MTAVVLLRYPAQHLITFQVLSLAVAVTGLVLGAVVSDHRRAELRLRQHQAELSRMARLATAGALGAAIIHEISQPLATIAA